MGRKMAIDVGGVTAYRRRAVEEQKRGWRWVGKWEWENGG